MGTGLGAAPGFAQAVIDRLRADTGLPLVQAPNLFEALAARDGLVELSAALRGAAVSLTKVANDLRWLASGPRCGLGELRLPELQPGSSIMPGKVNPVMSEMLLMACAQVVGNDATVAWAGAAGNFELNAMIPVIAVNVLASIQLIASGARLFADRGGGRRDRRSRTLRGPGGAEPGAGDRAGAAAGVRRLGGAGPRVGGHRQDRARSCVWKSRCCPPTSSSACWTHAP